MNMEISQRRFWGRHRNWLTVLLLCICAWAIYLPTTQYDYVYYDDVRILKDHPELYGQPRLAADLKAIFLTSFPREEPLLVRDVNWAVESRIFGFGNPFGYHLGNVLLNGVVVALLFGVLLGMTRRYGFALAVAAAYLVLAVHVEPAAWIMGRKDILSALFMLLALGAQTRRLRTHGLGAICAWQALVIFSFVLALLSKISVLTFPLVLFLHAVFLPHIAGEQPPGAAFPGGRKLFREMLVVVPSLAISGVIYVWYQRTLAQMGIFDRGYDVHGLAHLWNLLMVNPLVFWIYLKQIFFPAHLAVLYASPGLQATYPLWQKALAALTVGCLLGGGLWLFARRKDLFFYYAAFFVLMIPYSNLIFMGIWVADRYVYFSSFCVLAIAVSVAAIIWQRSQRMGRLGLVVLGAIFVINNAVQILKYEPAWRNAETLWQNHIALPEHTPAAYASLAAYYYADFGAAVARKDQGRMLDSLRKMDIVVEAGMAEYWPDRKQTPPGSIYFLFFLRSLIEEVKGEPEAALDSLLVSDQLHPRLDSTNLNLSRVYRRLGEAAANPQQRDAYLHAARDRFKTYVQLAFRDREPPPEIRAEMADLDEKILTPIDPAQNKPWPDRLTGGKR